MKIMKQHCCILLLLSTNVAYGMKTEENKEELKKQIIKHQNEVDNITFSPERYITFRAKKPEIYDIKNNKIIKTISDPFYTTPLINEMDLYLIAFSRKKDDQHFCTLYNLKEDTEQSCNTLHPLYLQIPSFVIFGRKLLTLKPDKKSYGLYDIKNNVSVDVTFNDFIENCSYCPSKLYLSLFLKNNNLFCSSLIGSQPELVAKKSNVATFSPDSTVLAFFDEEKQSVFLYDTKDHEIIKGQATDKRIKEILFPHHTTVWYTADQQNYTIWDIEFDTFTPLDLGALSTLPRERVQLKRFLPFDAGVHFRVYSFAQKKLYTLEQEEGYGAQLIFTPEEDYAVYTTNTNLAVLYDTTNWKPVTKLSFEHGRLNILTRFSPDGNFLGLSSRIAQRIKLYDIKKESIIFESAWAGGRYPHFEFHPDGLIMFTAHDTQLIVYDYLNNRIVKIDTSNYITTYGFKDDILAVSEGLTTTLFTIKDLKFIDYIKEDITTSSSNFELSKEEQTWLSNNLGLKWYTTTLAACHDEKTVVIYNHLLHTKAEIKKNVTITNFNLAEDGLTLFFENGQEYVPMKDIVFEEINKKRSCIIA